MNAQQSGESKMRLIGYLYDTLNNNYSVMQPEDFYQISEQIGQLLQEAHELLSCAESEPEPEPTQYRRFSIFQPRDNNSREETEMVTLHRPFQTPPPAQQSIDPPAIERNPYQSNVTMTRGSNVINLSSQNDLPMTLEELNGDDDEDYQDYIIFKTKPKLTTKCFSKKEGREKACQCVICCEEYSLHQTLTLGCGHEFCKECVCDHFHHSVELQPYKRFYACPFCRADVKQVRVNYSKINAKNKNELMDGPLATQMKIWCK